MLPPFAEGAKDGAHLVCYAAGGVQRSFVGSPWLCQGLRGLRMTAWGGVNLPILASKCDVGMGHPASSITGSLDCARDDKVVVGDTMESLCH